MKFLKIITFIVFFTTVSIGFAQKKEVQINVTKVSDHIYMLVGQGGNIAISVGEDGVFMIDDQFAHLTPKILDAIKSVTNQPVEFLINTHWHGDHTGGNENMQKEGAIIVAHENVRKRMSMEQFNKEREITKEAAPKEALPVITFSKDVSFFFNNESIFIFHVHEAHTDGDAMVYFTESNVLHTGDAYFQGKYPYIDLNSGGSVEGYIAAIKKALLVINDATKIIPGHRNMSNKAELQSYVKMLEELKTAVITEIKAGKTEEDVAKNTTLTKKYDDLNYGDWFISSERIRRTFYKSLQKVH
ncbi:glyoxylase-like metal-dependent hydrolase (beta-lactamase superfamily II) [Kordia periserrulae]|uniref:beta-lactamase n=1 Tax=Kordia periserrulae TaxID=701523 RepID=A0A2T6C6B7_9FLAO|nr:MBL fold metallo-hydrolase [Kordia periserrulae]PTX63837.1 glyoxylase-like metal-dependent hydrolase (beta-lactamase superfamily II) [Kordia periserrulae]